MRLNDRLSPSFQSIVKPAFKALSAQVVDRLWAKDHRLWKPNPKKIVDRLGWLTVQDQMRQQLGQANSHPKDAALDLSSHLQPGTYVSVPAYTTPLRPFETAVTRFRKALMARHRVATTFGYVLRYLHSTGQLHKGGPNTGVFLELVDRMTPDTPIPGKPFSFGTLAKAQAAGDMESLSAHDRHAVRIQLGRDQAATVNAITAALAGTSPSRGRRVTLKKRPKRSRR